MKIYQKNEILRILDNYSKIKEQKCMNPSDFNRKNEQLTMIASDLEKIVRQLLHELELKNRG